MSRPVSGASNDPANVAAAPPRAVSSQMQAVMRVLAGQEERTLAQKLADPNRPTWEQYKKDNEDKLNLEGMDQKKMEEYRQQLDAERDKILARGTNHKPKKREEKKKSKSKKKKRRQHSDSSDIESDDSSDDDRKRKKSKKKRKKKHKKRHRHRDGEGSDSGTDDDKDDSSASADTDDSSGHQKRKRKSKRKKKKRRKENGGDDSDGSHYRLSKFFEGSGSD